VLVNLTVIETEGYIFLQIVVERRLSRYLRGSHIRGTHIQSRSVYHPKSTEATPQRQPCTQHHRSQETRSDARPGACTLHLPEFGCMKPLSYYTYDQNPFRSFRIRESRTEEPRPTLFTSLMGLAGSNLPESLLRSEHRALRGAANTRRFAQVAVQPPTQMASPWKAANYNRTSTQGRVAFVDKAPLPWPPSHPPNHAPPTRPHQQPTSEQLATFKQGGFREQRTQENLNHPPQLAGTSNWPAQVGSMLQLRNLQWGS